MPHQFGVELPIFADVPAADTNGYSQPGDQLWGAIFNWGQFTTRPYETNSQGWYEPATGSWMQDTHLLMWELNMYLTHCPIQFYQEKGKTYWLGVEFVGANTDTIGWKTASASTNDAAVWLDPSGSGYTWRKLADPTTNDSMDLAFVITTIPEPSTSLLVALGSLALITLRRQIASR